MAQESVKVVVRVRPINAREKEKQCKFCIEVDDKVNSVTLRKENETKNFTYDYVFPQEASQQFIYENTAFPLVESVVEGYNGTICAYGQTGCGKTFTMMGDPQNENLKGIIPRAFEHIIRMIDTTDQPNKKFLLRCSYLEIYNEEIHDLLGRDVKNKLDIKESGDRGVFIKDLVINVAKSINDMEKYMTYGNKNRAVGATAMNEGSSRSHCIFTIYIECSVTDDKGNSRITAGKLNLVDLAGSERSDKTKATGDRLKEATKINLSLSALGNVISALVEGKTQHIPYRDSKLTRLLQDSLGGNTKTIMIAAVSPADDSYDETNSTLRYASRAKLIKNKPKVNEDPKDAQLRAYADEIKKLREMLESQKGQQQQQQVQPPAQSLSQLQPAQSNLMTQTQVRGIQQQLQKDFQKEKDKLEQDLKIKDEQVRKERELREAQVRKEREERERLEALIREKENMLVHGGQANDEEKLRYKTIRNKIKVQKKEHERLIEEAQKKQEELLKMESSYNNLNDQVTRLTQLVTILRKKYQESLSEIRQVEQEGLTKETELLENIRAQDKELKLLRAIMFVLFKPDELEILRTQATWNEEISDFYVPPFIFKHGKTNFPKLPVQQANDLINEEKNNRIIEFINGSQLNDTQDSKRERGHSGHHTSQNQYLIRAGQFTSPQLNKKQNDQRVDQEVFGNKYAQNRRYVLDPEEKEIIRDDKRKSQGRAEPLSQQFSNVHQIPLYSQSMDTGDKMMSNNSQLPSSSDFVDIQQVQSSQKPSKVKTLQPLPPQPHRKEPSKKGGF